jgi:triacylglycerol lipase
MLQEKGYQAHHAEVSWGAGADTRANDLHKCIEQTLAETGAEQVNLIAHSMGGLDARHMLFNDRHKGKIHERIAALATVGTPHGGSSFADWICEKAAAVPTILGVLGIGADGLRDLCTGKCHTYNERTDVKIFEAECQYTTQFLTYASQQDYEGVFSLLKVPYRIIAEHEGDNDGLVSVESAKWRPAYFRGTLDRADHLNQLGWWDAAQAAEGETAEELLQRIHGFYATIAAQLP